MSQSLNHLISNLAENNLEVLNDIKFVEFELESIFAKEFAQALPNDLDNGCL